MFSIVSQNHLQGDCFFHLFLQIVCCCFFMFKLSSKIKKSQSCTHSSGVVVCRQLRLLVWRDETQQRRYQVDGKWKDDCTVLLGCNAVERLFGGWGASERKIMFVISIVDIVYSLQHRLHDKQCERDFTWRYRSCKAAGLSHIVSAASLSARADFISPSAAITFARASLLGMKKWRCEFEIIHSLDNYFRFSSSLYLAASASVAIARCSCCGSDTSLLRTEWKSERRKGKVK